MDTNTELLAALARIAELEVERDEWKRIASAYSPQKELSTALEQAKESGRQARKERDALRARLAAVTNKAGELASDVRGLVDESEGVAGLHLNGDVADWGSLLAGGRFERLTALDDLEDLLENGLTLAETDASASVAGLTQQTVTIICKTGGMTCKGLIECSEHLGGGLCGAGGGFPCEHKWEQKA